MKKPIKDNYKPFDLEGEIALAKWAIDYSEALNKYCDHLESVNADLVEALKIIRFRIETGIIKARVKDVELIKQSLKKAKHD